MIVIGRKEQKTRINGLWNSRIRSVFTRFEPTFKPTGSRVLHLIIPDCIYKTWGLHLTVVFDLFNCEVVDRSIKLRMTAEDHLFDYIEPFYNLRQKYSTLCYAPPMKFWRTGWPLSMRRKWKHRTGSLEDENRVKLNCFSSGKNWHCTVTSSFK